MAALALISDLMMQSQVSAAATRVGAELQVAFSDEALLAKAEATPPRLVIVDLSHPGLDPAALMARLKPLLGEGATVIAFGPHVHKAKLEAAATAGCNLVISRGQFHAQMDELLARFSG